MKNVFKNENYLSERTKFFFADMCKNLESSKVYTDNENYAVCQAAPGYQVWLWSKDNLSLKKLKELKQVLLDNFVTEEKLTFAAKKEVVDFLNTYKNELLVDDYFEMGTYKCTESVKPRECDAYVDNFHEDDFDTAALYNYLDLKEMDLNGKGETMEQSYEKVRNWLNNDNYWVLRNEEGKVVSMASFRKYSDMAKLGNVYTPVEERRKGYCTNLVFYVTNKLLSDGYTPLLYTDLNYVNSNEAYKKVGYEYTGMVVEFTLRKYKL